jgi:hypothetical protein
VGNSIAVQSARLRVPLASGQHADLSYSDWTLDAVSQRASAGTVQVQGSANGRATISAGEAGYRVDFDLNGATSSFTVGR